MADRTGIAEIDKLIEDFLNEPLDPEFNGETAEIFRDPEQSHGHCQTVSEMFEAFAAKRGIKVYSTDTSVEELGYTITAEEGGEIGFDHNDLMQYGFYPEHTVNSYYPDGQVWPIIIDFTASQYGYTEHPLVTT